MYSLKMFLALTKKNFQKKTLFQIEIFFNISFLKSVVVNGEKIYVDCGCITPLATDQPRLILGNLTEVDATYAEVGTCMFVCKARYFLLIGMFAIIFITCLPFVPSKVSQPPLPLLPIYLSIYLSLSLSLSLFLSLPLSPSSLRSNCFSISTDLENQKYLSSDPKKKMATSDFSPKFDDMTSLTGNGRFQHDHYNARSNFKVRLP